MRKGVEIKVISGSLILAFFICSVCYAEEIDFEKFFGCWLNWPKAEKCYDPGENLFPRQIAREIAKLQLRIIRKLCAWILQMRIYTVLFGGIG